ncbi:MAG TPA: DUF6603 domain-containing protein [Longimicrobiales bacterium]
MIETDDLSGAVADLGVLLGVLAPKDGGYDVRREWFANPLAGDAPSLANLGERLDRLVSLVASLLGPAANGAPEAVPGTSWYPLPDFGTGTGSPFHVVVPADAAAGGPIGLGVLRRAVSGELSFTVYGYVPLLRYDGARAWVVAGAASDPCRLGVRVTTSAKAGFAVGGVTFRALDVGADVYLDPSAYSADPAPKPLTVAFEGLTGTTKPATYHTLESLLDPEVGAWIGEVLVQSGAWLDEDLGLASVSVGSLLVGAGFVTVDDEGVRHFDVSHLRGRSAAEIALDFLFGVLNAPDTGDFGLSVVPLPGGGLFIERRPAGDGAIDYGVRLAASLDVIGGGDDGDGGAPASRAAPEVTLRLGAWLLEEEDADSWVRRSLDGGTGPAPEPGITLLLLRWESDGTIRFAPSVRLGSIGLDVRGAGGGPLFDVGGYTLRGAEVRGYLDPADGRYGFAASLDGLGIPLGPGFGAVAGGAGSNPVARSLLASGSGKGGDAAAGRTDPVRPAFSLSAAYVSGGRFVVQLYDAAGRPARVVTVPIQRALGPLHCEKLGIGWVQDPAGDRLSLQFDGGVKVAGLDIDLQGLSIGIPATAPWDVGRYAVDLQGLALTFAEGQVELSAGLFKLGPDPNATPPRPYTEYNGEALLKAGTFALTALGSYAWVPARNGTGDGYASLFVFAVLDAELGGPAFFYVTGLAAGFGYNRSLVLPAQDEVATFPLVAGASDPTKLGAVKQDDGRIGPPDPATALAHLDRYVPPERGEYWLAAGVRFTSFDLIHSTALLVVEFGRELEVALLGLSWISLPPPAAPGASAPVRKYAYAELGIEVRLRPAEGVFSATAALTSNSYVIDPACRLTGGFAFYAWFGDNPHAGDFVLTLGGYHPRFQVPAHYPRVPRLGFDWPVSREVSIGGEAYFALTPSAVMAGGGLQVLYSSGALTAWFKAQMDALVEWAPFHYTLDIGVTLGASYRADLGFVTKTFKVELAATLSVWGPPMGGKVHVNWYIISFTVRFGAKPTERPAPLEWMNAEGTGFAQTLLPGAAGSAAPVEKRSLRAAPAAAGAAPAVAAASGARRGPYTVVVNDGLLRTFEAESGETVWVVRPNHFVFSVATAIPATELELEAGTGAAEGARTVIRARDVSPAGADYRVCVRPMRATLASSVLTIGLTRDDDAVYDLAGRFDFEPALETVPAAKWGRPPAAGTSPEPNAVLPGRLMGLRGITPKMPPLTPSGAETLAVHAETAFTYDTVDAEAPYDPDHLPLRPDAVPDGGVPTVGTDTRATIGASLMSASARARRDAVYAALRECGFDPGANGSLAVFAADPGVYLDGDPLLRAPAGAA